MYLKACLAIWKKNFTTKFEEDDLERKGPIIMG